MEELTQHNDAESSPVGHDRWVRILTVVVGIVAAAPFVAAGLAMSVQVSRLPFELGWYAPMMILQSALLAYGFGVGIVGLITGALSSSEYAKEASAAVILIGLFFMTLGPAARHFAVDVLTTSKASPWVFFIPVALFVYAASLLTDAHRQANRKPQ